MPSAPAGGWKTMMLPTFGSAPSRVVTRWTSTRSPTSSVGSMDPLGIRYGLIAYACIAIATMNTSSTREFLRSAATRDMTPEYGSGGGACRRHEAFERARHLAAADRDAALGEVADEARALVGGDVQEALEVRHRARRQVVEHEQRVLGRTALLDRHGQPALRILPVAGHRVPGHD